MKKLEVIRYQELSANAWPAMNIIFLNGWIIRVGDGYTRRANSVLPINYHGRDVEEDILVVEDIYQKYSLPAIFQLPDYFLPQELKEKLLSRGYEERDESLLMAQKINKMKPLVKNAQYNYDLEFDFSDEWFSAFGRLTNKTPENTAKNQKVVRRIPFDKAFAFARDGNEIIGLGLGVLEREYLGIYDMTVSSDYRRQGVAQAILQELLSWGKMKGTKDVYLQVQGDNTSAIALYNKIGFIDRYHYRYLIKKEKG